MNREPLTLLPTDAAFPLAKSFDYSQYIDSEQELWALFPEVVGKRVNFIQVGLSAFLYAEADDDKTALANDETYVLMPHADNCLRQVRMKCIRRLSLDEYRMSTHTAIRAGSRILSSALQEAGELILGDELMADLSVTSRGNYS
jgi:hypothetical protein